MVGKKKTNEEYISELAVKNPNVVALDEYINAKTPIRHRCLIHNIVWMTTPDRVLRGAGCHECLKDKVSKEKGKTNDEYVSELAIRNPDIIALDKYINAKVPIRHKCTIHNEVWLVSPEWALSGAKCPKCLYGKRSTERARTHDEYVSLVSNIAPTIKVVDKYVNSWTKIKHQCTVCGTIWEARPGNILNGTGCPACALRSQIKNSTLPVEDYLTKMKEINPNIELIGEYKNRTTKVRHKCLVDGYEWDVTPSDILSGRGCPLCSNHIKKTHEEFVNLVSEINNDIIVVGEYVNSNTPIKFKCKTCGHTWSTTPSSILRGSGCAKCGFKKIGNALRKTHSKYVSELANVNKNIIPLEEYAGSDTPILHRCLIDGFEWRTRPNNLLQGCGCPKCNESKGETSIAKFLDSVGIKYERQKRFCDCKDIRPLPFDFYLPNYNVAIEYDGEQHFKPVEFWGGEDTFNNRVKHDNIKNEYCDSHGIRLLRIPYTDDIQKSLNNFLFAT